MKAFGPTRIPNTVPRPVLVVARTRPGTGYRRAGALRGVVVLADSLPGPRLRLGRRRARRNSGRTVLGFVVLALLTLAATRIVRASAPFEALIPMAIGGGVALVAVAFLLAGWAAVARLVSRSPGSFSVVGRDHRLDLETIDRVSASWSDRERFDTLQCAGQDPRWGRWTATGMRERHEDDR
ncbi:hypothetical protein GA0111570_103291 [Raineyella antarctica]|uniref:Uncharacterized protein n=1 Tax=Raineyella antarctica TaxID=1577474 RepID=A0A1G6GI27_9ACTN|nr:hypothetical protein [Raineyella antarctica]SDB81493.1 hypothetical protein GA0111570_103291 [Raineyella antarctica]